MDFLRGSRARLAQGIWLAVATAGTAVWAVVLVSEWGALQTVCHQATSCAGFQLNPVSARTLAEHGVSLAAYAGFTAAVLAVVHAIFYGLAALIAWRKPEDRGALVCAFFLLLAPLSGLSIWITSSPVLSGMLAAMAMSAIVLSGLLFPDGRFAPQWTRWLAPVTVISAALVQLPINPALSLLWISTLIAVVPIQIYRFRHVSGRDERQRAKWAFAGLLVGVLGLLGLLLPFYIWPAQTVNGSIYSAFTVTGINFVALAIPVTLGIAVLHSRLWDIDHFINRALVYTILSALIVGIYIGSVVGLQTLFGLIVGGGSTLAIALSTLAIAALFGPLRRRVQALIDRRFYRRKYDASRTLAEFSAQLRDEVDLGHLNEAIVSVVTETMQPAHVSLWLAEPISGSEA